MDYSLAWDQLRKRLEDRQDVNQSKWESGADFESWDEYQTAQSTLEWVVNQMVLIAAKD